MMNSRELLSKLHAGDAQAATVLFDRYAERLVALAQSRIGARLGRRIDGDDVVQSAFRSFFVHAADNEFTLNRSGDLWRLLASITLHKLQGQIERQTAARRAMQREDAAGSAWLEGATQDGQATPDEVLAMIEQWELATDRLTPLEQSVLAARLRGESIAAIAESLGKSSRTVRRALGEARLRLEGELLGEESVVRLDEARWPELNEPALRLDYADFTLERLLGAGGMGKVYRAMQHSARRTVAVKALQKIRQRDPRAVEKFVEEAGILARLDHPGIVRLHGIGRFPGGGFFLVMDFVEGDDLQARLECGPMGVADAVRVLIAVAEAIGYAHAQGIVHGDIKPGNALVDRDQRVVVTDFGLGQFIGGGREPARGRIVGGTEGYMAPEIRGGATPTPAADIYGLGALLWALVKGRPPDAAGELRLPGGDGEAWERICARCLAADQGDRFSSAGELVEALRNVGRG